VPQVAAYNGHRRSTAVSEVVPRFVDLEVAVPHLSPAVW
jgi:hypothetical protein